MTNLSSSTTLASMIDRTSDAFVAGCGFLHEPRHQRVGAAMYRILAGGQPASIADIASRAEVTTAEVEEWVGSWPAVFRDDDGAVTGFFGLSVDDGFNHRADVDGMGTAWTWCTYDPLFIARVLGATVRVSSHCPVTGTEVRVETSRIASSSKRIIPTSRVSTGISAGGAIFSTTCWPSRNTIR